MTKWLDPSGCCNFNLCRRPVRFRLIIRLVGRGTVLRVRFPPRTYMCPLRPTVSALPEEGRQQAANHAATEEAVQKSDHPGVQDTGAGTHQHG